MASDVARSQSPFSTPRLQLRYLTFFLVACSLVFAQGFAAATEEAAPATQDAKKDDAKKKDSKKKDPPPRYFAITGATLHPVSGPVLEGSTVLCKNGKIAVIGHKVEIPNGAEVLDATGFHVYPGLVAVSSSGLLGGEPPENTTNVYSLSMSLALSGGITTAVTGNTAAKLTFGRVDDVDDMVLKRNIFTTLPCGSSGRSYSSRYGGSSFRGSGSGHDPQAWRKFREALEKARQFLRDRQAHEEKKKIDPKAPAPDSGKLSGDAQLALKLIRHEVTAVTSASNSRDLRDLALLAGKYDFPLVVRGATEGWTVASEMGRAGIRAIITPRTRSDRDKRTNRPNGSSIENARVLHEHGVSLAIIPSRTGTSTSGLVGRDLMHLPMEAAFAVRGGLSQEAALKAITLEAAKILGIDHRVGSIEIGKDADFAIVDGDILHYMTMVRWTVVGGRIAYDKQKDSLLEHIRPEGDRDAPAPPDYWPRRLGEEWGK
ncbi:Imidazolonepropionase [subsurface metagenome]